MLSILRWRQIKYFPLSKYLGVNNFAWLNCQLSNIFRLHQNRSTHRRDRNCSLLSSWPLQHVTIATKQNDISKIQFKITCNEKLCIGVMWRECLRCALCSVCWVMSMKENKMWRKEIDNCKIVCNRLSYGASNKTWPSDRLISTINKCRLIEEVQVQAI